MKKETILKKREEEIKSFYRAAFCIDGDVEVIYNSAGFEITGIVKLTDSERGTFYIGNLNKSLTN
jgi:hypothetical protein